MINWLRDKLAATCPVHHCAITVTDTEVFCGACRSEQLNKQIVAQQFVIDQLKSAIVSAMVNQGWEQENAWQHINEEFTTEQASHIMSQRYENKDDNTTIDRS